MEPAPTYDPAVATAYLRAVDPLLGRVIEPLEPLSLGEAEHPYRALVRAILYQQLAGAAAATIERRFYALFNDRHEPPEPAQLLTSDVETLRSAGVSRQKAGYLFDLAAKAAEGVIDDHLALLPDDEVAQRVMAVKGIGRWTADMLLIFCLRRPDILPVGDLGIRTAAMRLYSLASLPTATELERLAEPWRPYRSAAAQYLWRWFDAGGLPPEPITTAGPHVG